jgi:serine kinase of HPr protein (carbohydrate metabolism regulator)
MSTPSASVHASAVLVGERAVLIRGPSGAGKSRLAFDLILAGRSGQIPATRLVGDDRLYLEVRRNELAVRPARSLEGLIEIRGLGIRKCDYAAEALVGLVVDLNAADAERLPAAEALRTSISGIELARMPVGVGFSPLPMVVAALTTIPGCERPLSSTNCPKGFGNHISPTIATK